jgi:L-alanine-DL-glutamate epimerase-like enolase superfamily enzyme
VRIKDIEVITLRMAYEGTGGFACAEGPCTGRVTSLVRVSTDAGLEGIGSVYSHPEVVRVIVEDHLRPLLIGEDALDTEALWNKMYALTRWYGRKGAAVSALGGVDTACWDIRGKAEEKPIYCLLGGSESQVPAYASGMGWQDDLSLLEEEAARHLRRGFRRVKMRLGWGEEYDLAALEAAQRGVGRDGEIMVDGSQRYSLEQAIRIGEVLYDSGVLWFEEPFPPEDIDSYVALHQEVGVPLAAGENDFGVQGFREMFRAGAIDFAQPDASRAGGISEVFRIGRLADRHTVWVATHTWSDAVALIANAHVVAALSNGFSVEVDQTGNPFVDDLLRGPLHIENGLLRLSEEPGLGVELDAAALERYTWPRGAPIPDGNYSDMVFGAAYWFEPPPYVARA